MNSLYFLCCFIQRIPLPSGLTVFTNTGTAAWAMSCFRWCESLDMGADATSQVDSLVSEAVSRGRLQCPPAMDDRMRAVGDFSRMSGMMAWFPCEDPVMWHIFPDLRFREVMFRRLTGDWQTARQMLWADLAFNWRDKRADTSLAGYLVQAVPYRVSFAEGKEKDR